MLYTGKGDNGTTKTFGCDQRISKSSAISEALGAVDEINSFLGILKMDGGDTDAVDGKSYQDMLADVQQDLFIVQAQLAGADKRVDDTRVKKLEAWIGTIESELPPITSFFVSGGTKLGATCDFARTLVRRAERRIVAAVRGDSLTPEGVSSETEKYKYLLAYMNRLSSLLYALARLANHRAGIIEEKPHY